ncbi:cytochrome c biogenesis protein ResB [Trichlorobacter ammonificans]|uniref:Cytochrome c-type biogenesis protein Ccs1/ResB n=1 Tax=Trichlorobacter ammonificans TaxID=2916410 RepID=A0ABM9D698_9BACT|nr:cytochrome c biogenesis protein ResB [Trichlorobacter ammonificans]CAH2029902.1 Cytochrome c-type biogenesis protein Ccs1/ResB [Trichlorobacter ammonificans]
MSTPSPSPATRLLDALASLRLTMALLLVLALVSIIGTVIPQGELAPEYLASIGGEQGNRYKLYAMLGFFNMYHSWWFVGLLSLLSANLLACSLKRLPAVWRLAFKPDGILSEAVERSATGSHHIPADAACAAGQVEERLRAAWGGFTALEHDGARHLFAQRRPWNRLAAYVVHASIILIFIGAIIGSLFGFKGFVTIPEGDTVSTYQDRRGGERPLGFEIRCDQFTVTYYDAPGGGPSQMPKEFKSILTLTENGTEVPGYKHARVIVNEPLTYRGITFYQSSYGQVGSFSFRVGGAAGAEAATVTVESGHAARLPDGSSLQVLETVPDVAPFIPGLHGPAARVALHPADGTPHRVFVSFAAHPELNRQQAQENGGPLVEYLGGTERPYTGLQVNKDPGVWVVWVGCILMCLALYAGFFMPHQRIWVRITEHGVTVAGHTTRGQEPFRRTLEELVASLTKPDAKEEQSC